ncbi:MAG TPA: Yip1 family protein [Allosphingosinicella sp.]|jgi:hypothetical protein
MQDTPETPGGPDPATPPPPPPPSPAAPSHGAGRPGLVERVRNILIQPASEWRRIDGEGTSTGQLITGYALILAAIAPLAMLIGLFLTPLGAFLGAAMGFLIKVLIALYGLSLGTVLLLGLAIDLLAPSMGGTKNGNQAMKLAVYSGTAFWVAGLILILPSLWWLWLVAGVGYGGYLLWLGLPILMKVPAERAGAYAAAAVGIWVVLFLVLQQIAWRIIFGGMIYGMM